MRRLGKFYVSQELVEFADFSQILTFMEFIPVRVELLYDAQGERFEYVGMSKLFKELDPSCMIPGYDVKIIREDGVLSVEVTLIE